jgi:NitT/TauT family transport system substrate-binding protein
VRALTLLLFSHGAYAQEVKVNEVLRSLFYAPQHVALRIGAFEQEGLKIVGPKTTWGVQAALTEIISGSSNIALMGPEAAGLTQEVVAAGKGATPALVLVDLLKKVGIDPNKDVTIRNIPISANIIPSYLEPNTQFAQAFEPMVAQAVAEKKGYRVASIGALLGPMPYTAYMASAAYIEKNPAVIQSFTNAVYKGLIWTEMHSAEEIAKLIAPDFPGVPPETILAVVAEYKKVKVWATDPLITPEGMDQMVTLMVDGGVMKSKVPYQQIVNPTFAQKAVQSIKR